MSESQLSGSPAPSSPLHLVTILYRSSKSFPGFLDGLLAQDRSDWRLHIIDNGDPVSAATAEACRDPRISISHNHANFGFARAANQGMRMALAEGAKAVVLINNDLTMPPDLLSALGEAERRFPGAVLSPRIMEADKPGIAGYAGASMRNSWIFEIFRHPYDPSVTEPQRVEFAPGCCLLVPAGVLAKVGFLDERFFVYWEDSDFCMRLNEAGIPIYYLPTVGILHIGAESSGGVLSPTFNRYYYSSYMQFLKKHFGMAEAVTSMLRLMRQDWQRRKFSDLGLKTRAMLSGLMR